MNSIVIIDEELCIGCAACVELCPQRILYIEEESSMCKCLDETKCDRLRGCEKVCPVMAITIK
ncbi:MAG: ferredoxin [bacterium]|nr:ferredoxin [bacterium]